MNSKNEYVWFLRNIMNCVDCGESNPRVIDFDHITKNKILSISNMVRNPSFGISDIKKEVDKCVVRCSNCHRLKTAKENNWYTNMKNLEEMRLQTYSGKMFYPFKPEVSQVDIKDIAHSLSMQCRYNGHLQNFYSVAQHSTEMSYLLDDKYPLYGLLHDATEAYVADVPSPIKKGLLGYNELEESIWSVIASRFGLDKKVPPEVKIADVRMLMTEKRDIVTDFGWDWHIEAEPFDMKIEPKPPKQAESEFLERFNELKERR